MVKILSIFMATLAAISSVAQAGVWHCTPGLKYCGATLQQYDNEPLLNDQANASLGTWPLMHLLL
ncbi:hypothetical protein E4U35_001535 [Claviceps purpurea]|nr:hypothetical protein E4U35_001535 [Claviceps purpurea]